MNYQKDTSKKDQDSYGQTNGPQVNSLVNKPLYGYVNKKTEKLVTALYMVTDCMDTDEALKIKIRLLGVELLSDMYKLPNLSPVDKHNHISLTLSHINEVLSLIEISCTIGFISEMNTQILKSELGLLITKLEDNKSKDNHFAFTLDDKMFDLPAGETDVRLQSNSLIKDKRTSYSMSFNKVNSSLSLTKGVNVNKYNPINKQERKDKILALIKDKKDLPTGEAGLSIKDISTAFTDCSEKTIQRELNLLVSKGQIKKTGAKRWSRYQAL
ncbi:MAG: hypothetical protein AAB477_00880 [Patescibacteria group bacterium]